MIHYDRAWKVIMQEYLRDGMSLFFPQMADDIDWEVGGEFLNKEFHGILESGTKNSCQVDLLVRLQLRSKL